MQGFISKPQKFSPSNKTEFPVINVKRATTEFPVERDPCAVCPNMQNECWPVKLTCQHAPPSAHIHTAQPQHMQSPPA